MSDNIVKDEAFTHGKQNILTVSEIKAAGFTYITHLAYVYDPVTFEQVYEKGTTGVPRISLTYLLGDCEEEDVRFKISDVLKMNIIQKLRELKIMFLHQVYAGEIYIPLCGTGRHHHIFARGNKIPL